MAIDLKQFVQRLTMSGLMSAEELSEFQHSLPPEKRLEGVRDLVGELIRQQKLTRYQAATIVEGNINGLAFGEYVVLDRIGAGGMGQVLKARHRRMQRIVALKMLPDEMLDKPGAIQRFQREVTAAAKLIHPNIVTAFDAGENEGLHYLVMQYVEGQDLAAIIEEHGRLPIARAVDYVMQAARGLHYAHSQGVVHRDIKPANLLVDTTGTVKILDMGLARIDSQLGADDANATPGLTNTGQIMGTVDYMSPEQAMDTRSADLRTDIYSLGCTLYRLITGDVPYDGDTIMKKLMAHRDAAIPSLGAVRPEVPPELDAVYQKMVAKEPRDRQQSMAQVMAELKACEAAWKKPARKLAEAPSDARLFSERTTMAGGTTTRATPPAKVTEETVNRQADRKTDREIATRWERRPRRKKSFRVVIGSVFFCVGAAACLGLVILRGGRDANHPGVAPPTAVAPFDPSEAQLLVRRWAEYLEAPAERSNSVGMKLVLIPPGEFDRGSPATHRVKITEPFYLGAYEVTQREYEAVMGENPSYFAPSGEGANAAATRETTECPVENITWFHAAAFCNRLSQKEARSPYYALSKEKITVVGGDGYRLPTEAEWEYAARAGSADDYGFGKNEAELTGHAWFKDNSASPHPVGQKLANGFGLYDMHGNVWEWCRDWFDQDYYEQSPEEDPAGPDTGQTRVVRGGSCYADAAFCRATNRVSRTPDTRHGSIGFRVVYPAVRSQNPEPRAADKQPPAL